MKAPRHPLSRRGFLRGAAGTAALGALAACSSSRTPAASGAAASGAADITEFTSAKIDWKQFSGTTLTVSALQHPWYSAMSPLLPQFTELTGITVTPSVLGEDQYVAKVAVELSGGSPTPDVFMVNQFGQAVGSNWLAPLDDRLADPKLTDPAWFADDDFFPGARAFGQNDGTTYALPLTSEVEMLFVRNDLVPTAPTTMEELVAAAAAAKKGDVAGFGSRAVASASETPWPFGGFVFTNGGLYLDGGRPTLDSPANVTALTTYAQLLQKTGPDGVTGWGYLENNQAMAAGRLALWTDSSSLLGGLKDPTKSKYTETINAYPFPSVGGKSVPNFFYWLLGINAKSANPDAAWLFTQWATSKPVSQAAGLVGASPARASSWQTAEASKAIGADNAKRILDALQNSDPRPMVQTWQNPKWAQVSDVVARAVNSAVAGQPPAEALRGAQAQAITIMA
jgi:multiple sugar transport system substrate-binding protein